MSQNHEKLLIPPEFYFQASIDIVHRENLGELIENGTHPDGLQPLPHLNFANVQESIEHQCHVAWNDQGIAVDLLIHGKNSPMLSKNLQQTQSGDGIQFFIDTRDSKSNRRTNRFCHAFQTVPVKGKDFLGISEFPLPHHQAQQPLATPVLIPVCYSSLTQAYRISCWLSRDILNGFDPENVPSLGFFYRIRDQQQRDTFFSVGSEFPYESDPSLWPSLKLIR